MKAQAVNLTSERTDIIRTKHNYGLWYGAMLGFSFAVFCWGLDGYLLSNHHGMQPWLKFGFGAVLCTILGGITGRLSAKLGSPLYAALLWLVTSFAFGWLSINIPLSILPKAIGILEPQTTSLLHYVYYEELGTYLTVANIWLAIFFTLAGLLQIPLSDSGVFSTSFLGKLTPILTVFIIMGIAGTIVDNGLINAPLRSALLATDSTIQFVIDNHGKEVDRALARRMHAGAFRAIDDSVTQQRELIVSGYDALLGEINVLVRFENDWVECIVLYNQPSLCKVVGFVK